MGAPGHTGIKDFADLKRLLGAGHVRAAASLRPE
jgi:hypothetical protein